MPWWSWLVIWACLGLALLAVLVISAICLYRKGVAVFGELDVLAQKIELLEAASDGLANLHEEIAVLQKYSEVHDRRRRAIEAMHDRRETRRSARLTRARALTRFDASTREWFPPHKR